MLSAQLVASSSYYGCGGRGKEEEADGGLGGNGGKNGGSNEEEFYWCSESSNENLKRCIGTNEGEPDFYGGCWKERDICAKACPDDAGIECYEPCYDAWDSCVAICCESEKCIVTGSVNTRDCRCPPGKEDQFGNYYHCIK